MRRVVCALAALAATALSQTAAHAHFIWATIENRQARFALLENIAEAPDAKFDKYVANLSPHCGGKSLSIGPSQNGARYVALPSGQEVIVADSIIGAKDRDGSGSYLLVYHAKGAASLAAADTKTDDPVELRAHRVGQSLVVSVTQNAAPVAESEVWVQWPGETEPESNKTDSAGIVTIDWPKTIPTSGFVGLRAMTSEAKAGELDGKKYTSVHHWATLTFPLAGPGADKAAWNLLKSAHDSRLTFGDNFPGLTADVVINDNGVSRTGKLTYSPKGVEVALNGATECQKEWANGALSSLLGHRRGGDFAWGDGKNPITFAEEEESIRADFDLQPIRKAVAELIASYAPS